MAARDTKCYGDSGRRDLVPPGDINSELSRAPAMYMCVHTCASQVTFLLGDLKDITILGGSKLDSWSLEVFLYLSKIHLPAALELFWATHPSSLMILLPKAHSNPSTNTSLSSSNGLLACQVTQHSPLQPCGLILMCACLQLFRVLPFLSR